MPQHIELIYDCIPVPWMAHAGYGRRSFNPRFREKEFYQWHTKKQYQGEPITGPLLVMYDFRLPIPKSMSKKNRKLILDGDLQHTKKPDVTNLIKFCEDCIKGIVFVDDSQVVNISAVKRYSDVPQTIVNIWEA